MLGVLGSDRTFPLKISLPRVQQEQYSVDKNRLPFFILSQQWFKLYAYLYFVAQLVCHYLVMATSTSGISFLTSKMIYKLAEVLNVK
ncbi:MAG: hypothetical protein ACKPCP_07185, partial [Sphaerospermopsis kisseleviana]